MFRDSNRLVDFRANNGSQLNLSPSIALGLNIVSEVSMYGVFSILSQPYRKTVISSGWWSWEGDRADPARAAAGRAQRGQAARSRPRSSHQGAATGSRAAAGTQWGPPMGLVRSGVRGALAGRAAWAACGGRAAVEPFPGAARGAAGNRLGAPHPSRPNCSATSRTA